MEDLKAWHKVGFAHINENRYKEAEQVYDQMFHHMRSHHGDYGTAAYYRGIAKFLQGRHKEAYEDFKIAHQLDLHMKRYEAPSFSALRYMEKTLFPTKEIIKKNQEKLIHNLNSPRNLEYKMGANVLRTIHKWNSASPLYSPGPSQGGGYFLTLRNKNGGVKGIAIDPGYDFFTIFRELGLGISDIDAILITHDHDDHTESVEGILSLLAKFNDHNHEKKSKVLDIFGSAGVLLKFHGLLSATDLVGNREINFKLLIPGNTVSEIEGQNLLDKYGFIIKVFPAYHTERWTNQESSVGLLLETGLALKNGEHLKIGITGDSRYVEGMGKHFKEAQVLLINIGSVEKEEGKLLGQHLGICGCINLLKEARLGKPLLAILTEFGEEFEGKREVISEIIENWAQPMEDNRHRVLRLIPADLNLEVRLSDLTIRETDTNIFFPYDTIKIEEGEILKYKFNG
ncbi:hypothetical protein A2276_07805 [candidate division WOR-1 bacterium RIFOXYA12_FULL_43_27]|uniref:Metallo-beta-lactamase domain-containing protein n=1 Tax=candidate division WOR-1 bacterium RIFOXYC2_FULL_46_14 TaxID=1802587 RepID=A0A1F4U5X7_UNCSA|nr:MAG: hypothetical protein A2276_07805 [candidate division WOR-1 bacterium RIFOXYA12_FULL_43_27]OGC20502.1 MAG: hypothetical protein A2292_05630 [candidate division WOR-1 bacterium RIFOXYB2_FULL_46_45]OGC31761.1 MAG: hypothetical protein A2232_05820 [candidate division WOR-1 bacterium RIFOXYA2_FULL_46_56]OGC40346.1 MAG: hypothetical protein A2438_03650 [candidate division WOR-1 bacterium RIFOXYC2_FULL_46_14]